ncbi:Heat shock protein [Sparassis crispa]|uniref:Heat shock protein n=1 Tax=Sparassis crispa TaxID=139825 RepID=A0A401G677_9APHY|nr:Heat shock protein [Sparassis crispa]GBE77670.1 Heat shock protein [Sparassis crispa]
MSLTRWFNEPFYGMSDFDRMFDDAFTRRATDLGSLREHGGARGLMPRMDLHEDTKSNVVTASFELPGLKKEDVDIDVQNNVLTVSGESKMSSEHEESGYTIHERRSGKFTRAVSLPHGVKPNDIKAHMENGVLTVSYPKVTPEASVKKIAIS